MKVFNIKEVDERFNLEIEGGIKIKPFLTIVELNTIVLEMKEKKTSIERHFVKNVLLVDFCTNIDISKMTSDEVYDIASELGLFETFQIDLYGYHEIDNIIKSDESIYNVVKEISDSLLPKVEEALNKIGDGTGLIDKIKGVVNGVNKKSD